VLLWYPTIAASKLIGIGFGLAALLMLFLAVRKRVGSRSDALAMCALMIALLSIEQHYWFWNRPDSTLSPSLPLVPCCSTGPAQLSASRVLGCSPVS
jgi:hypothetical protein